MRKIAIGDVHGCAVTLRELLKKVNLGLDDELIMLGDMIDRGFDSKGVFDEILSLREKGHRVVLIKGNHEEMMMSAKLDFFTENMFLSAGGRQTLASFGGSDLSVVDSVYWKLLRETRDYYESDGFIFVHGGLNFGLENPFEAVRDMRWIRDWHDEINYEWLGERIIVHGHSPRSKDFIQQMHANLRQKQVLDIDSGCVFHKNEKYGCLTAYDTEADELIFQEFVG